MVTVYLLPVSDKAGQTFKKIKWGEEEREPVRKREGERELAIRNIKWTIEIEEKKYSLVTKSNKSADVRIGDAILC